MKTSIIFAYILLVGMTVAYCLAVWYGIALCSVFLSSEVLGTKPAFWVFIAPIPFPGIWFGAIHWQLLALGSVVWSVIWGKRRATESNDDAGYMLPMLVHFVWVVFAILLHIIGACAPMISIGYSLG